MKVCLVSHSRFHSITYPSEVADFFKGCFQSITIIFMQKWNQNFDYIFQHCQKIHVHHIWYALYSSGINVKNIHLFQCIMSVTYSTLQQTMIKSYTCKDKPNIYLTTNSNITSPDAFYIAYPCCLHSSGSDFKETRHC